MQYPDISWANEGHVDDVVVDVTHAVPFQYCPVGQVVEVVPLTVTPFILESTEQPVVLHACTLNSSVPVGALTFV